MPSGGWKNTCRLIFKSAPPGPSVGAGGAGEVDMPWDKRCWLCQREKGPLTDVFRRAGGSEYVSVCPECLRWLHGVYLIVEDDGDWEAVSPGAYGEIYDRCSALIRYDNASPPAS